MFMNGFKLEPFGLKQTAINKGWYFFRDCKSVNSNVMS